MKLSLLVAAVAVFVFQTVEAGTSDHRYKKDEHIELWVNKVGPYANPQEAYEYYYLPYCAPETVHHPDNSGGSGRWNEWKSLTMGEHLGGHALRHSGHDILFLNQKEPESCTTKALTAEDAKLFSAAIQHRWFYQMYLDDLPVWGMVGEMLPKAELSPKEKDDLERLDHMSELDDSQVRDLHPYVYTTRDLVIYYNKDQVVKVDLTSDPKSLKLVKEGAQLEFALHVQFEPTTEEFHSRFDRYLDQEFFKHPIHWFSVFNSFMMVLFLMGLVALILLRTLKKDYARYGLIHDLEDGEIDEDEKEALLHDKVEDAGWKQVHGDVFRAPSLLPLFAAVVGNGSQLVVLAFGVIIFAVLGPIHGEVHEERGEMMQAILFCYVFSTFVSGFTSGKYFKEYYSTVARSGKNSGQNNLWQATMGLTVVLLPSVTCLIFVVLNTVSLIYGTINSIPFMVILKLFFLYVFVSVPLCVVGTLAGRHYSAGTANSFPCRVNAIPRPIPQDVPWYGKPSGLIPLAGLLSFGSIFIELYYILTSFWNYKFYHVYGFLFGVYVILNIVVGMTSIIVVYFCLNAENYHWQWTAFGSGASTSGYVFLYGIYYYVFKTNMHGLLQFCFYFGYMALISINLGLLCGTLGYAAASYFVRAIFQNVKVD